MKASFIFNINFKSVLLLSIQELITCICLINFGYKLWLGYIWSLVYIDIAFLLLTIPRHIVTLLLSLNNFVLIAVYQYLESEGRSQDFELYFGLDLVSCLLLTSIYNFYGREFIFLGTGRLKLPVIIFLSESISYIVYQCLGLSQSLSNSDNLHFL